MKLIWKKPKLKNPQSKPLMEASQNTDGPMVPLPSHFNRFTIFHISTSSVYSPQLLKKSESQFFWIQPLNILNKQKRIFEEFENMYIFL